MNTISDVTRARIEAQGFVGLDDRTLAAINYWLRLAPAICMVWTAIGTALTSPIIVSALIPFAALDAILPGHPFDLVCTAFGISPADRACPAMRRRVGSRA